MGVGVSARRIRWIGAGVKGVRYKRPPFLFANRPDPPDQSVSSSTQN